MKRTTKYFGERSPFGYENPKLIDLVNAAEITVHLDERDRLFYQLREIFREDTPVTFLWPRVTYFVAHRRLHGLSSPFRVDPVSELEHLWLEEKH